MTKKATREPEHVNSREKLVQRAGLVATYNGVTHFSRRRDCPDARTFQHHEHAMTANNGANGPDMLTAEQVRDITGVPVSTLHDWAAKRERGIDAPGPHHIRLSNRHRRWAREDVHQWIRSARI